MTLEDTARRLIDTHRYLSLGTVDPDGQARVSDDELTACAEVARRTRFPEQAAPFPLEMLRARVTEHSVHVPRSDPEYGTGIDSRRVVVL